MCSLWLGQAGPKKQPWSSATCRYVRVEMGSILRFRSDAGALINGASDYTAALITQRAQLTADEIVAKALGIASLGRLFELC